MRHRRHFPMRGCIAATALAVALPFNALAAEPTPDPPEPYLIGTVATVTATATPIPTRPAAPA